MKTIIFTLLAVFLTIILVAQVPQAFKYQAVARNNAGEILVNHDLSFQISIIQGSISGTAVYVETHDTITNDYGLVNLEIGNGEIVSGDFTTINWGVDSYFLQVEMDENGETNYQLMGTSQLLSVPYALHAENVSNAISEINDLLDARADTTSIFLGKGAGENDDGDNYNTVLGIYALHSNTDRSNLVAIGDSALFNNGLDVGIPTQATKNTAVGSKALYSNTTGHSNTATGYSALYSNIAGFFNTAYGCNALVSNTGYNNTATGANTLYANTTGSYNIANGSFALYQNTTGSYNNASGSLALSSNTEGSYNTALGHNALTYNAVGSYNVATGNQALYHSWGSHNTACGNKTLYNNKGSWNNTAVGSEALYYNDEGSNNSAIGAKSLYNNTSGLWNTATGFQTLYSNTSGQLNTAIGYNALYSDTSGYRNTATGISALYYTTNGSYNTASGAEALLNNKTGEFNTAIGSYSGVWGATNIYCTYLGYSASNDNSISLANSMALGSNSVVTNDNQVRIGNSSVNSIGGYANWTNVSDKRFKQNITEDVPGLEFIIKLRPVTYNLDVEELDSFLGIQDSIRKDERLNRGAMEKAAMIQTGFLAQEVEEAAQSLGYGFSGVDAPKNENDFYGLRYAEFVVPLVKAVQEQQTMIETQQVVIEELIFRIEELESR